MATPAVQQRRVPGLGVARRDAWPPPVIGLQTALPIFIGYTEKAALDGQPAYLKPIKIRSLADYEAIFGGPFRPSFDLVLLPTSSEGYDLGASDETGALRHYSLRPTCAARFLLGDSLSLFYANGGGACYVVSVGNYTADGAVPGGAPVEFTRLKGGLRVAGQVVGPTMTVIPEATLLADATDFGALARAMLEQGGSLGDRVSILDVWGTASLKPEAPSFQSDLDRLIAAFRTSVGDEALSYGMAYFPFLRTSIVPATAIDYTHLNIHDASQLARLQAILKLESNRLYGDGSSRSTPKQQQVDEAIDAMAPPEAHPPGTPRAPGDPNAVASLNRELLGALPTLAQAEHRIAAQLSVLPASPAMAGVYAMVDGNRGVWSAPANVTLSSVVAPTIALNDRQQADLNLPLDGKAVDVIREFAGRGSVPWGARTLDGNSNDWRYVHVRRTLIYVEQSIKTALHSFLPAANDGYTWAAVVAMVSDLLEGLWSQGGLMGATASEAFSVQCGLGSTMTAEDVLQGEFVVQVTLQMVRPAEFMALTFRQRVGGAL